MMTTINNLTDRDKVAHMLAETEVQCSLSLTRGSCSQADCACCPTRARFEQCYAQLPEYDKLVVDTLSKSALQEAVRMQQYSSQPVYSVAPRYENPVTGLIKSVVAILGTATTILLLLRCFIR